MESLSSNGNNFIVNMSSCTFRISTWIFVLSAIFLSVHGDEVSVSYFSDYKEINCQYNLMTGDRICDCKNRNKVARFVVVKIKRTINEFQLNFTEIRFAITRWKCQQFNSSKLQKCAGRSEYIPRCGLY